MANQERRHSVARAIKDRLESQVNRISLVQVASSQAIREQLKLAGSRWQIRPPQHPELDLAFVQSGARELNLVGIKAFGQESCIGARIVPSTRVYEYGARTPEWSNSTANLLAQGAQVALLTESDLRQWGRFYQYVDEHSLLNEVGPRVVEYSGLERTDWRKRNSYWSQLKQILTDNAIYLKEQGVTRLNQEEAEFDLSFVGADGLAIALPIYHVRQGHLEDSFLTESVDEGSVLCPGVVIPRPGETKRQAYARAQLLAGLVRDGFSEPDKINVPVASDGQFSLWQKLGFGSELEAQIEGADLTPEELYRLLYLGPNNRHPGELAKQGFSLPGSGAEYGLDIMLFKRDSRGNRALGSAERMLGIDFHRYKREEEWGLVPVNDVGAILIVPEDWSFDQIKKEVDKRTRDFNYRNGGQPARVLVANRTLLELWRQRGSVFGDKESVASLGSLRRRVTYGFGPAGGSKNTLVICRDRPVIGGNKIWIEQATASGRLIVMNDFGRDFNGGTPALSEVTHRERTDSGMRRSLFSGEWPMVPGIYASEYILASAAYPGLFSPRDWVASFLRAELYHRVDPLEIERFLGEDVAARIRAEGGRDYNFWFRGQDVVLKECYPTHSHMDHVAGYSLLDHEAPIIARTEAIALIIGQTNTATVWRDRIGFVSLVTRGYHPFKAYEKKYRAMYPVHFGDQKIISGDLIIEQHLVDHSIPGAAMVSFSHQKNGWSVLMTGDLKLVPGGYTERAIQECAGRHNIIVVENTNDAIYPKVSANFTEDQVRDNLKRLVWDNNRDLIIVKTPPNHPVRLSALREVAEATGRHLAIGFRHAEMARQLRAFKGISPLNVEGFDYWLAEIGDDVALWRKESTKLTSYQKILVEWASQGPLGVVDQWSLSQEPDKWLVVVAPTDLIRSDFGGLNIKGKITCIHSSYFPYTPGAKHIVGDDKRWLHESGRGQFLADFEISGDGGMVVEKPRYGLHASGHASFQDMVKIIDGLLGSQRKGKQVILVHGERPGVWADSLAGALEKKLIGVRVRSNIAHYNHLNPLEQPGFRLPLD